MSQGFLQQTSRCLNQPAKGGLGGVVATSESQPDSCLLEPVVADAPANGACTTHHEQQQHAPALAVSSEVITKSSTTGGVGSSNINIGDHPDSESASSCDSSNLKAAKVGKRKAGGWKTTPFIFVSEFCDKLAAGGLLINLISYLIQVMHFRTVEAATTVTNFSGASGLTPLLAAFVADAYLGRYATIIASTCVQLAGILLLALTAVIRPLSPPPCPPFSAACRPATRAQTLLLYAALALTALGGGGIRACAAPFGAEQVVAVSRHRRERDDQGPAAAHQAASHDDDNGRRLAAFFTGFYCAVCVALLCAATGVVYVQEAAGWAWGLGVPAVMVAVGGVVFVAGSPWYRRRRWGPCGGGSGGGSTPMVRLVAVVVAAVRKRRVRLPERAEELWHGEEGGGGGGRDEDGVELDRPLKHTNQFRFLDRAAVVEPPRPGAAHGADATPSRWRLAPVAHIEELKCLLRMLPIWLCTIPVHAASAQQHTFSIQQARAMDRRILPSSSFRIPPGSYAAFALLPPLAFLPLHARLLHSRSSSTSRTTSTASAPLGRIGAGLLAAAAGLAVAGAVETHRRRLAHAHHHPAATQPSAYWLVPQYAVQGLAEAAMVTGQLEFAFSQSPDSLRSTATAVHWATVAAGSFLASAVTGGVHAATDWLASDDLDACRLAWFYWLLAGGTAASAVVYVACARWYCRHAPAAAEDDEEEVGGAGVGDPVVLACH